MKYYNISISTRVLYALLSGVLIYPLSFLEKYNQTIIKHISLVDALIATIFALLVMIPFQKRKNKLKSLLLIIGSILIYTTMVRLVATNYNLLLFQSSREISITISGGLGALLTGVTVQFIAPIKYQKSAYPLLIILGLIAGYLFSITIGSNIFYINVLGYMIWQTLVCYAIAISKK